MPPRSLRGPPAGRPAPWPDGARHLVNNRLRSRSRARRLAARSRVVEVHTARRPRWSRRDRRRAARRGRRARAGRRGERGVEPNEQGVGGLARDLSSTSESAVQAQPRAGRAAAVTTTSDPPRRPAHELRHASGADQRAARRAPRSPRRARATATESDAAPPDTCTRTARRPAKSARRRTVSEHRAEGALVGGPGRARRTPGPGSPPRRPPSSRGWRPRGKVADDGRRVAGARVRRLGAPRRSWPRVRHVSGTQSLGGGLHVLRDGVQLPVRLQVLRTAVPAHDAARSSALAASRGPRRAAQRSRSALAMRHRAVRQADGDDARGSGRLAGEAADAWRPP